MQGFGPEFDAEFRRAFSGTAQFGRDGVQILVQTTNRFMAEGTARQDQGLGSGVGREGEECVQVPFADGPAPGVEHRVQIADITVDGTDSQSGGRNVGSNGRNSSGIQVKGDVVADPRESAQINFLKTKACHSSQGIGQCLLPEADG